ncbi:MAG: IPT/TIG domain-containing protein [Deltaproteobacteria bacterium]|nr:IPT/TIG domain-containing protein [Deltaproteobacteria bacterium]
MRPCSYLLTSILILSFSLACSDDKKTLADLGVSVDSAVDSKPAEDLQPDLSEAEQLVIEKVIPDNGPSCPILLGGVEGNCDGTITVTLVGKNFERGAVVYIDGGAYLITELQILPTTISFQLQKQPYDTSQPHKVSIQVRVGDKASNRVYFQYTAAAPATDQSKGSLVTSSLEAYRDWESERLEGRIFVEGKTDVTAGPVNQLVAEFGIAPRTTTPISPLTHYNFAWSPASFETDDGAYDVFSGRVSPTVAGDHDIAFRFSEDGGFTWTTVDGDETNLAYEPSEAGTLQVTTAPVGYCRENSDCAANTFEVTCKLGANWREHRCVECVDDEGCTQNPRALGPRCSVEQNLCYCAEEGDCASNDNGHLCFPQDGYCGCQEVTDCPEGEQCFAEFPAPGLFGCNPPEE